MTGLRSLYISPTFTKRINELSEDESRSVLDYLFRVQIENHGMLSSLSASRRLMGADSGSRELCATAGHRANHTIRSTEDHVKYKWSPYDVAIWNNSVRPR